MNAAIKYLVDQFEIADEDMKAFIALCEAPAETSKDFELSAEMMAQE